MAPHNSNSKPLIVALYLAGAFAGAPSQAQDGPAQSHTGSTPGLTLSPTLVQSNQSGASALGLDYSWKRVWLSEAGQVDPLAFPSGLLGVFQSTAFLALDANGSLSSVSSETSGPLQSLNATAGYDLGSLPFAAKVGLTGGIESTQDLERRQTQFGLSGLIVKMNALTNGDTFSVLTMYGTVQPDKDLERQALLGRLSPYERWNLNATYDMPLRRAKEEGTDPFWRKPRNLELGYRHWQELDAPGALRSAGLDRQRLGYVLLSFDGDYFIQYSNGRQPFDQKSQSAIKLGWDLKLTN